MSEDAPQRPPWSAFRAALDAVGFRPSRRLGQNFLLDDNAARAIVRDAELAAGDFVLEVGPGCGFLSVHLALAGVRLLAVEVDPRLAAVARRFLEPWAGGAEVLEADVMAGPRALDPAVEARLPAGPWHLVSNLPYSISAPLLGIVAARAAPPRSVTVLVQREVAERLAATPGTRAWGPLSVAVQGAWGLRLVRHLGPQLFWPRPRVESTVVRGELRPDLAPAPERARLRAVAARLLRHRRQALGRVLGDWLGDRPGARALLADLGWDPRTRAEGLGLEQLAALADRLPRDLGPDGTRG